MILLRPLVVSAMAQTGILSKTSEKIYEAILNLKLNRCRFHKQNILQFM